MLWDHCLEKSAAVHNLTSSSVLKLQDLTPRDSLARDKSYIINVCQFGGIEWVYYRYNKKNFLEHEERI